jgi:serine/threonine protein kinase
LFPESILQAQPDMNERYEIRGLIAEGGGGNVHLGWDRQANREVAIKRAAGADADEALMNEAAVLRRIPHPNIVSVLDAGTDEHGTFIVMELAGRQTLEDIVSRRPLNPKEFEQLVTQTLEGIMAAHSKILAHLDLKPQNIMVEKDEAGQLRIKILDFGVAALSAQAGRAGKSTGGPVMGSLFFMAPERFDHEPGDARSDLYSLGCVYYFALTGQPPFRGEIAPQVMVAHLRHQFTPLAEIRTDLPAFIPQWVEWLLSRKPEDRPADASTALAAFRERRIPV